MELHVHNTALTLDFNYLLIPFTCTYRLDNLEYVPAILNEFLEDLREGSKTRSQSIWHKGSTLEIHLQQGTPLSPPKNNANVVLMEMHDDGEVCLLNVITKTVLVNIKHKQHRLPIRTRTTYN